MRHSAAAVVVCAALVFVLVPCTLIAQDGVYRGTLGPNTQIYDKTGTYHNSFTIYPPPPRTRVVFEVRANGFTPILAGVWSDGQALTGGSRYDRVSTGDGLIYLIVTTARPGETGSYELTISMSGVPVASKQVMRVVESPAAPPAGAGPRTAPTGSSAQAHDERARALAAKGQDDEAVGAFTQAIQSDARFAPAYEGRAYAYYRLKRYDAALDDIGRFLGLEPGKSSAWNLSGWLRLAANDAASALTDLDRAIALDANSGMAYTNRGRVHSRLGDSTAAIADYTRAIAIDSKDKMAYNNRAMQYKRLGQRDAAERDLQAALQIDPDYALARRNLQELDVASPVSAAPSPALPTPQPAPTAPPMTSPGRAFTRVFAISVGISDYGGRVSNLKYTAADAGRVRDALIKGVGMRPDGGVVLTDGAATRSAFRQAMAALAGRVGPDDLVVVFFSGHGGRYARTAPQAQEPDGYDESIELVDGPMLDDEFNTLAGRLGGAAMLLVLDSCFSGGFSKDAISAPRRMGLFSSEEDVTSAVAAKFRAGGYLASFLAEAIGDHAADADDDRQITALELSQYLHERYREDVKGPIPEYVTGSLGLQHLVVDRGGVGPYQVLFRW